MLFISMSPRNNIITPSIDFVRRPESDIQHIYSNKCAKFLNLKSLTFLFLDRELVLISTRSIIKLEK